MSIVGLNETHDPARRSWVFSANASSSDYPLQNLPFGIFRRRGAADAARAGVAIGDQILDVAACAPALEGTARAAAEACAAPSLRPLMQQGGEAWSALRLGLSRLLDKSNLKGRRSAEEWLVRQSEVEMLLPFRISNFTDFFASIRHATNAGRMFRPDNPLLPNYKYVPIAYQGRAPSFRVSGCAVQRPCGQIKRPGDAMPERGRRTRALPSRKRAERLLLSGRSENRSLLRNFHAMVRIGGAPARLMI
ncbi:fumarylacetoacetase [Bradyrhizobium sp. USDA 4454]